MGIIGYFQGRRERREERERELRELRDSLRDELHELLSAFQGVQDRVHDLRSSVNGEELPDAIAALSGHRGLTTEWAADARRQLEEDARHPVNGIVADGAGMSTAAEWFAAEFSRLIKEHRDGVGALIAAEHAHGLG